SAPWTTTSRAPPGAPARTPVGAPETCSTWRPGCAPYPSRTPRARSPTELPSSGGGASHRCGVVLGSRQERTDGGNMRIRDVLSGKASQQVVTIAPDATVRDLVALLAEHNIGAVVVSTDGTTVSGIVSERDVVRHLDAGAAILSAPVSQIMTS